MDKNLWSTDYLLIKKNILARWVNHNISTQDFLDRSKDLNIITDSDAYTVALLYIFFDGESTTLHKLHELCYSYVSHDPFIMSYDDVYGNFVLIFSHKASNQRQSMVTQRLEDLKNYLAQQGSGIKMTLGKTVNSYKDLPLSYDTANQLFNYFLIYPHNEILYYDELINKKEQGGETFKMDYNKITNYLLSKQSEELIAYVDHVFQDLVNSPHITPALIRTASYELLLHIHQCLGPFRDVQEEIIMKHTELVGELHGIKDHYLYSYKIKSHLLCILDLLEKKNHTLSPVVDETLSFIHGNYNSELSLASLSEHFNMNATYLGQLFKTEVGVSFNGYVNNYRIERAKELLLQSHLKTVSIAREVGYQDPNYFYRLFKKSVGISPTEFRRL